MISRLKRRYEAVVIGTSAGGLQALSGILSRLPARYPIPLVVVQHRARDSQYLLEEILQSKCSIPIRQANEKEKAKGNAVYFAPPDYHLMIETDRTFSLSLDLPVRFSRPSIDVLFESAAHCYGDKLIGIILTGANDDGAAGIAAIAGCGGLTIAQNPNEAAFPYMVQASINTKSVGYVWSLATIGNFLLNVCKGYEEA